jgi:hypothetical protein
MAAKSKQQSGQEEQESNLGQQEARREKTRSLNSREWEKPRTTVRKKTQLTLVARCEAGSGHASVTKNGLTRWSHHRTLSQSRRAPGKFPGKRSSL